MLHDTIILALIRSVLGVVTAAVVAVPLAASAPAPRVNQQEAPTGELRDCRSRGEGGSPQRLPPVPGLVRLGPLVIWPSVRTALGGPPSAANEWPYVVKAPVVLPARARVVLAIAPEATSLAAFQHRGRYVSAVRFEACREREPAWAYSGTVGRYTGFPFSIGVARRSACVPMELWVEGRAAPLRSVVPVGRRSC